MPDIIKTWPGFMDARKTLRIFDGRGCPFGEYYYFSLGRGKPKTDPEAIWIIYRGRILGRLPIVAIVRNDGTLPKLRSLENQESAWQFKDDVWVCICEPPIVRLRVPHIYLQGFRGWRYFNLSEHMAQPQARWNF